MISEVKYFYIEIHYKKSHTQFLNSVVGGYGGWEEFINGTGLSASVADSTGVHGSGHRIDQLFIQAQASLPLPRARRQGDLCQIVPVWHELQELWTCNL